MNTLVSIITVVYNDRCGLVRTIKSISRQKYTNIEFIVIDGGSTDGTLNVIKENIDKLDYWISESDDGIYHAMNKGLKLAKGGWVWYMNAGDECLPNALLEIRSYLNQDDNDLICGGVNLINESYIKPYFGRMTSPHQGILYKTKMLKKIGGFNENYSLISDRLVFDKILAAKVNKINSDILLANFYENGVSQSNEGRVKSFYEYWHYISLNPLEPRVWLRMISHFFKNYRIIFSSQNFVKTMKMLWVKSLLKTRIKNRFQ